MKILHLDENVHVLHDVQTNEELFFIVEVDSSSASRTDCNYITESEFEYIWYCQYFCVNDFSTSQDR